MRFYVIGGKWKLPIINSICNGNKRFREIERSIPGLTTSMLSRELKDMEANQLIKRTVTPTSRLSWNIHLRIIAVPLARSFLK